ENRKTMNQVTPRMIKSGLIIEVRWFVAKELVAGSHARLRYLFSRVSIRIFVPISMKGGTWTTRPVSIFAGLYDALAVAPFKLGSVSTTSSVTVFGSSMPTGVVS